MANFYGYGSALKRFWWALGIIFIAAFIYGFNTPIIPGDAGISKHPHIFGIIVMIVTGSLLAILIYFKLHKDDGRAGALTASFYTTGWPGLMVMCAVASAFFAGAEFAALIQFITK